ncbi:hypothetical protein FGIG_07585 [Fasciola gigantica]|uniref:Uncharacterized protein n=1 Tax=Fasciola gigantica TaxID=46835 RepID=A0A504Y6K1_FASGI|nr:hypothetical protein FGIG_07585 [Fasciola gigantica]
MTLFCRREIAPCEKLGEFFSKAVNKISDVTSMQRALLLEKPTAQQLMTELKSLQIPASSHHVFGTISGEVPHHVVWIVRLRF